MRQIIRRIHRILEASEQPPKVDYWRTINGQNIGFSGPPDKGYPVVGPREIVGPMRVNYQADNKSVPAGAPKPPKMATEFQAKKDGSNTVRGHDIPLSGGYPLSGPANIVDPMRAEWELMNGGPPKLTKGGRVTFGKNVRSLTNAELLANMYPEHKKYHDPGMAGPNVEGSFKRGTAHSNSLETQYRDQPLSRIIRAIPQIDLDAEKSIDDRVKLAFAVEQMIPEDEKDSDGMPPVKMVKRIQDQLYRMYGELDADNLASVSLQKGSYVGQKGPLEKAELKFVDNVQDRTADLIRKLDKDKSLSATERDVAGRIMALMVSRQVSTSWMQDLAPAADAILKTARGASAKVEHVVHGYTPMRGMRLRDLM